jgi:periplasmic copper chaperone A
MTRLLLILALLMPTSAFAELEFSDARIKNLPPSVPVRAGYVTIHNPAEIAEIIVGARSDRFASVEFHRSLMQDGMMRMEPVAELTIAAGASLQLAPGGLHMMLMQPVKSTRPGEKIELFLLLQDGSEQRLVMEVIK